MYVNVTVNYKQWSLAGLKGSQCKYLLIKSPIILLLCHLNYDKKSQLYVKKIKIINKYIKQQILLSAGGLDTDQDKHTN